MEIICEQITGLNETRTAQLQAIYEANFPASERKPFQTLANGIEDGSYICMVARDKDDPGAVVAVAFLIPLANLTTIFLEYIAVDQAYQGQGIGSKMFHEMVEYLNAHNIAQALIWEVEPPEPDNPEDVKNKRIRFYEKLGAKLIALSQPYVMPDFEDPASSTVPLRLMQVPIDQQPDKATVSSMIKSIYDAAYPDHGALRDAILDDLAKLPD